MKEVDRSSTYAGKVRRTQRH